MKVLKTKNFRELNKAYVYVECVLSCWLHYDLCIGLNIVVLEQNSAVFERSQDRNELKWDHPL
jgi:hypothetical protein